jgi:hypothetical protein
MFFWDLAFVISLSPMREGRAALRHCTVALHELYAEASSSMSYSLAVTQNEGLPLKVLFDGILLSKKKFEILHSMLNHPRSSNQGCDVTLTELHWLVI